MSEPMPSRSLAASADESADRPARIAKFIAELTPTPPTPGKGAAEAINLLRRLFRNVDVRFALRLWNGMSALVGNASVAQREEPFTLVMRHPDVVKTLVTGRDPLRLADAYFRGDMDIEGNFFAAVELKDRLREISLSWLDRLAALLGLLRMQAARASWPSLSSAFELMRAQYALARAPSVASHSKIENREAIAFHYDVSNEFYALWLDEAMVYSCAYFTDASNDLRRAQQDKLDHVCRKLLLHPGEHLLDVGCGWGALAIHAAKHYGVSVHGITLSERQLAMAQSRVAEAGLQARVKLELLDYRDLRGDARYDKVSSVGMFEHVGLKNLPVYFSTVQRLLKPGGLFLNHGITHDVEGWEKTLSTEFINRYVFPDGQLDTISNIQRVMEKAGFEIHDVESLRRHYALTLRHWVAGLERHHAQALKYVNESTYRVWRLYMAASALEFEAGELSVHQVLGVKRGGDHAQLPLTRCHLYE